MKTNLIAPCGMNCAVCSGFLRDTNKCPGCRAIWELSRKYIKKCIIRNCSEMKNRNLKYCSDKCGYYPCDRLKRLDKRYRTKYGMSMIENLESIKNNGIKHFVNNEKKRWIKGNKIFCVHKKRYYNM